MDYQDLMSPHVIGGAKRKRRSSRKHSSRKHSSRRGAGILGNIGSLIDSVVGLGKKRHSCRKSTKKHSARKMSAGRRVVRRRKSTKKHTARKMSAGRKVVRRRVSKRKSTTRKARGASSHYVAGVRRHSQVARSEGALKKKLTSLLNKLVKSHGLR